MSARRLLQVFTGSACALGVLLVVAGADVAYTVSQPWPAARHDAQRTSRADVRGPWREQLRREHRMGEAYVTGEPVISLGGKVSGVRRRSSRGGCGSGCSGTFGSAPLSWGPASAGPIRAAGRTDEE